MKRILLLLLLLPALCFAGDMELARMGPMMLGGSRPATASCDLASDILGTKADGGSPVGRAAGTAFCFLHTPTCYGPMNTAYVKHVNTSEASVKICVYSDDGDDAADSGDSKVGCTAGLTSSTVEWKSGAISGTLTSGKYWVCMFVDDDSANAWTGDQDTNTVTIYYDGSSDGYDTELDNLAEVSGSASAPNMSIYITIGE